MRFPSLRSHNMATPSLPPDAHREPSGETVTALMYPVWPTRLVRSLQLDSCHTLTSLSQPPDTMSGWEALGEKATERTSLSCPTKRRVVRPVLRSHRRSVPSHDPDSANWPSEEMTTSCTKCPCPRRAFLGYPYDPSSRVSFHTITVLSREAERIISGPSLVVAMALTHPEWPSRVPRIAKLLCSELMVVLLL